MRLRSIELSNVRRFAGKRAKLSGIGDGISVMSQPNEFGKSTFFDAIHAAFFERYNSNNASIKALRPHSGGSPQVSVEVDLPEGRFKIMKRWINRAEAKVDDANGRLIARDDEAEAWIDRLLGSGLSGPSGLLWVRQGLMGLEPEGGSAEERRERERGLSARRDLLSSIAGEIDMMTGGRRMDAVIDLVSVSLSRLATPNERPRAGGEWARAVSDEENKAREAADLRPKFDLLSADLVRRSESQRALNRLTDPSDVASRQNALTEAEAFYQGALAHQARVNEAKTALHLAKAEVDHARQEIDNAELRTNRLDQARVALSKAEEDALIARSDAEELDYRYSTSLEATEALGQETRALRARLRLCLQAQAANQARVMAEDIKRRLDRASNLQASLDQLITKRNRIRVTNELLEAANEAQSVLGLARAKAELNAVTIETRPDGADALINGIPLLPDTVPIRTVTELDLPGFGSLLINPGAARSADSADEIARAEYELAKLLADMQVDEVLTARNQWTDAQRLENEISQETARLAEVAPAGLDPLRREWIRTSADAEDVIETVDDIGTLTDSVERAEATEDAARAATLTLQELARQAGEIRAAKVAGLQNAQDHLSQARADAGDPEVLAATILELQSRMRALSDNKRNAEITLSDLQRASPDVATSEARFTRAKAAVDQARIEEQRLREELASLNATIAALADLGIEERLSTLTGEWEEAKARVARYKAEVSALTRLRRALEEARNNARDTYFGPVLREIQPLLAILYPGAQLAIDDQSLLPAMLTRNGQAEALNILSGGTREQVAILTRLAFARLFADSGRPIPVILDDALVHSDEDRIEAMFDALHRTARNQQILVLTCRQRAFAALGGDRVEVQVEEI